jgi:hypothetical protein
VAYASVSHVQNFDTGRPSFSANSKPTATQVGIFLEQTGAELDGILRAIGAALPVATTATSALKLLEYFNSLGGWAMAEAAAPTTTRADEALKLWEDAKKMLLAREIDLDLGLNDSGRLRYTSADPVFTMDEQF